MWLQRSKKSEDTFEVSTDVMILLGTFTGEIKVPKFKLGFFSFFPFFPVPYSICATLLTHLLKYAPTYCKTMRFEILFRIC